MIEVTKYGAEWCAPCKLMKPEWDALAKEFAGKAAFREVDTDTEDGRKEAAANNVLMVPCIIFRDDTKVMARFDGKPKKDAMRQTLKALL